MLCALRLHPLPPDQFGRSQSGGACGRNQTEEGEWGLSRDALADAHPHTCTSFFWSMFPGQVPIPAFVLASPSDFRFHQLSSRLFFCAVVLFECFDCSVSRFYKNGEMSQTLFLKKNSHRANVASIELHNKLLFRLTQTSCVLLNLSLKPKRKHRLKPLCVTRPFTECTA